MKNTFALSAAAMALLSALATAPTAQAGLIGADVTYQLLTPDTNTVFFSIPTQTITPATSLVDTSVDVTTTFTDNEIIITNTLGGMFAPGFTGPRYLFSGTTITNVTIDNASSSDFLGVLSFTANAIMINFAGISPAVGSTFILDVNSSPAAVPEPSTWALMALGFGVLGGAGYWTRRRSVSIAA